MSKLYTDALDNLLDRPIAFNPSFKKITGSTNAALLLSQAFYWTKRTTDKDGWFYKTRADWMDETGLTEAELDGAREKCRQVGVIEEKLKGVPATLHYRIIKQKVYELLGFQFPESTESGKDGNSQNPENQDSGTYRGFKRKQRFPQGIKQGEADPAPFDFSSMTVAQAYKVPTLKMFNKATGWLPADILWEQVHTFILANHLTEEQINSAAVAWIGKGYNRRNVMGILEWAKNGTTGEYQPNQQANEKPAINTTAVQQTQKMLAEKMGGSYVPRPANLERPRIGKQS